jgi:hypothetical protein
MYENVPKTKGHSVWDFPILVRKFGKQGKIANVKILGDSCCFV